MAFYKDVDHFVSRDFFQPILLSYFQNHILWIKSSKVPQKNFWLAQKSVFKNILSSVRIDQPISKYFREIYQRALERELHRSTSKLPEQLNNLTRLQNK